MRPIPARDAEEGIRYVEDEAPADRKTWPLLQKKVRSAGMGMHGVEDEDTRDKPSIRGRRALLHFESLFDARLKEQTKRVDERTQS